jgi:hypothetical protein
MFHDIISHRYVSTALTITELQEIQDLRQKRWIQIADGCALSKDGKFAYCGKMPVYLGILSAM